MALNPMIAAAVGVLATLAACSGSTDAADIAPRSTSTTVAIAPTTQPPTTQPATSQPPTTQPPTTSTVTTEPDPPTVDPSPFIDSVDALMRSVLAGEPTDRWTGYPFRVEDAPAALADLAERLSWWDDTVAVEMIAAEIRRGTPIPVVVASKGDTAAAFVMGQPDLTRPPVVERLPEPVATSPGAGETVAPTDTVWFDSISVEGPAWAAVNSNEAKVVADADNTRLGVVIPAGIEGTAVVLIVMSTPELPVAATVVVTVESPP